MSSPVSVSRSGGRREEFSRAATLGAVLLCAIYIVVRPLANQFEPYCGEAAFAGMVLCLLGLSCGTLLLLERHITLPARIALAAVLWAGLLTWGALRSPHLGRGLPYAADFAGYILLMLCGYVLARRDVRLFPLACRLLIAMAVVEAFCGIWQKWMDFPRLFAAVREQHALLPDALQGSVGRARLFGGNVFGSFAYPNAFGAYLLLGIMLLTAGNSSVGSNFKRARWAFPVLAALCSLPMLLACYYADSKGAFAALLGGAGAWFVFRQASRKPASAWMWLSLAALGVAALTALLALATFGILPADKFGLSLQVRFEYWRAALRMIGMAPLQGVGLAGFAEHYTFFKTALGTEAKEAHNDFLQLWVELGPAGVLGYLGIWAMVLGGRIPALNSAARGAAAAPASMPAVNAGQAVSARRFEAIALIGALAAFVFMYTAFSSLNAPDLWNLLQPDAGRLTAAGALFALAMPVVFGCVLIATRGIDGGAGLTLSVKAALCALLLHQLIDFDLRAQALAGAMFLLGGMLLAAGAPPVSAGEEHRAAAPLERCGRVFPLALSLLLLPLAFWIPAQAGLARVAAENDEADVQTLLSQKRSAEDRAATVQKQLEIVRLRREVVEHVPYDSEAWVDLALAQDAAPLETSEAFHRRAVETSLRAALERRPYSHIPRLLLANFYAKNGAWTEAGEWYQRAIERYPLHPGLRFWLGDALLMSGRIQPAVEAYEAAFEIDLRIVDSNIRASAMFSDPRAGVFSRHWREGEVLARVDGALAEAARAAGAEKLQRGLLLRRLLGLCTLYRDAEHSGALNGTFQRELLRDVHATVGKFAMLQPQAKPGWRAHAALFAAMSYQLAPAEADPAARHAAWQRAQELQEQARQAGATGTDPQLFKRLRRAFDADSSRAAMGR